MADETSPEGGNANRVTLALVDAKVGEVRATVAGLGNLIKSENAATREALADLKGLPVAVAELRGLFGDLEHRVSVIEKDRDTEAQDDHVWRRVHLPTFVLSLVVVLIGAGELAVNVFKV